jgi:hypothetical protein
MAFRLSGSGCRNSRIVAQPCETASGISMLSKVFRVMARAPMFIAA